MITHAKVYIFPPKLLEISSLLSAAGSTLLSAITISEFVTGLQNLSSHLGVFILASTHL